ncbi:MAG: hypothetical protein NT176_18085 [Proteobacteria bacterium]|nr:hypothetical protein [Pseudomonadota bacterium]
MQSKPWRDHAEHPLTAESLQWLFNNEIACIRVKAFATPAECAAFVAAMDSVGLNKEYTVIGPNVKFRPRYIGLPQFEYRKRPKEDYFATVETAYVDQAKVFAECGFDPLARLATLVRAAVPGKQVGVAKEPGVGRYYAGIIRETTGGTNLHMDFSRQTAPGYEIARVDSQLATNFYASGTEEGGETTMYNFHYDPADYVGRTVELSPFDPKLVEGREHYTFKPAAGDLILFNSRCPWNPRDDGQRRMGIGSFLGRAPGGDVVMWS